MLNKVSKEFSNTQNIKVIQAYHFQKKVYTQLFIITLIDKDVKSKGTKRN